MTTAMAPWYEASGDRMLRPCGAPCAPSCSPLAAARRSCAPAAAARTTAARALGRDERQGVTNAGFILIAFFPLFILVLSMLQWRLDKRKDARKAAAKARTRARRRARRLVAAAPASRGPASRRREIAVDVPRRSRRGIGVQGPCSRPAATARRAERRQ